MEDGQVNLNPTYRKRYRYSGSFNFTIQNTKYNFKGDPDYQYKQKLSLTWSHSVDNKARPGTTFSANVNAGSTKYNRQYAEQSALEFSEYNQFFNCVFKNMAGQTI